MLKRWESEDRWRTDDELENAEKFLRSSYEENDKRQLAQMTYSEGGTGGMEIFRREGSGLLDHIEEYFLMYDFILSKLNSETEKKVFINILI